MNNKRKYAVVGLMAVVAVAILVFSSTASSARYFMTIDELRQMGPEASTRSVTVSGAVLGSTIVYDTSIPEVRFTIAQVPGDPDEVKAAGGLSAVLDAAIADPNRPQLQVVYRNVKPEALDHRTQAIVRGRLAEDGTFIADELLLRCPTRYQEDVPEQSDSL